MEVEFPDEFGRPLLRSGVSDRIWELMNTDKAAFQQEVKRYFALRYPDFTVVRAKYPTIYLRDDRRNLHYAFTRTTTDAKAETGH